MMPNDLSFFAFDSDSIPEPHLVTNANWMRHIGRQAENEMETVNQPNDAIIRVIGETVMGDQYPGLTSSLTFHRLRSVTWQVSQQYPEWARLFTDAEAEGREPCAETELHAQLALREAMQARTPFMEITFALVTQLEKEMRDFMGIFPGTRPQDDAMWSADARLTMGTGHLLLHLERRMSEIELVLEAAGQDDHEVRFLNHFAKNAVLNYCINQALLRIQDTQHDRSLTPAMRAAESDKWQLHVTLYRALLAIEPDSFLMICQRLTGSLRQKNRLYRRIIADWS